MLVPNTWRLLVAIMLGLVFVILLACGLESWSDVERGMVIYKLESEAARLASGFFFEKMTAIAQLSLALLGAIWALLIVKEERVRVQGAPSIICFIVANLSFASSLLVYNYGYDFIVRRIFYNQAFDIEAPFVTLISKEQQIAFIYGCLSLVSVILLAVIPNKKPVAPAASIGANTVSRPNGGVDSTTDSRLPECPDRKIVTEVLVKNEQPAPVWPLGGYYNES